MVFHKKTEMKKSHLLLLILVLLSFGYFVFKKDRSENDNKDKKTETFNLAASTFIVKNRIDSISIVKNGIVLLQNYKPIQFDVSGTLLNGEVDYSSNLKFIKNQLLFRIDNRKQFLELRQKKNELAELIKNLKPEIELRFPKEIDKWNLYLEELDPSKLFLKNVEIHSPTEKSFFSEKGFFIAFDDLKKRELEMEKYFYLAPEDGEIQTFKKQQGTDVQADEIIAKYTVKKPQFVVKTVASNSELEFIKPNKTISYFDGNNSKIGFGKVLNIYGNEIVTTVDLPKSLLVDGKKITVDYGHFYNHPYTKLPKKFLNGNSVKVLVQGNAIKRKIKIVKTENDKCLVVGLKDGEKLITYN